MRLDELKPAEGSRKEKVRVGRGIAAGKGKTAGRGTKGQNSRTGGGVSPYFEGGQLPFVRRLPFKRGFNNVFRIEHQEINLDTLAKYFPNGGEVTPADLVAKGLIRDVDEPLVILGRGDVTVKYILHAQRVTASAKVKIEQAGGTIHMLEYLLTGTDATVRRPKKEVIEARKAKLSSKAD